MERILCYDSCTVTEETTILEYPNRIGEYFHHFRQKNQQRDQCNDYIISGGQHATVALKLYSYNIMKFEFCGFSGRTGWHKKANRIFIA